MQIVDIGDRRFEVIKEYNSENFPESDYEKYKNRWNSDVVIRNDSKVIFCKEIEIAICEEING